MYWLFWPTFCHECSISVALSWFSRAHMWNAAITLLLTYRSMKLRWVSFRACLKWIKKQKVCKSPDIASCVIAFSRAVKTPAFPGLPLQNTWIHMPSALRDKSVFFTCTARSTTRIFRLPVDCLRTNAPGKKSMPTWKTPTLNRIQSVQKSDSKYGHRRTTTKDKAVPTCRVQKGCVRASGKHELPTYKLPRTADCFDVSLGGYINAHLSLPAAQAGASVRRWWRAKRDDVGCHGLCRVQMQVWPMPDMATTR